MTRPVYCHVSTRSFDDELPELIRHKLDLELCIHGDELDDWRTNGWRDRIRKLKAAYNPKLTLHGPIFAWDPASKDRAMRERVWRRSQALFEIAELTDPALVVLHSSYIHQVRQYDRQSWLEDTVDFYRRLAGHLPNERMRIAIENIFEINPFLLAEAVHAIDHPQVGHCFDIGHFTMFQNDYGADRFLEPFGQKLFHLHLHDNYGREDLHLPPGDAAIDFTPLLSYLKSYTHPFSLTVEGKSVEHNLRAVAWVREHVPGFGG